MPKNFTWTERGESRATRTESARERREQAVGQPVTGRRIQDRPLGVAQTGPRRQCTHRHDAADFQADMPAMFEPAGEGKFFAAILGAAFAGLGRARHRHHHQGDADQAGGKRERGRQRRGGEKPREGAKMTAKNKHKPASPAPRQISPDGSTVDNVASRVKRLFEEC